VRKEFSPDGLEIMDYCNLYGLVLVLPFFCIAESLKPQSIHEYLSEHPQLILDIVGYCLVR
jgi:hypothetical protein